MFGNHVFEGWAVKYDHTEVVGRIDALENVPVSFT